MSLARTLCCRIVRICVREYETPRTPTPTLEQVQSSYGYFNLYLRIWTKSSSDNARRRKRTCHVRSVRARSARISLLLEYSLVPLTQLITLTRISHSQEYDSNVTNTYLALRARTQVLVHFKPCRGQRRVNVTSKFWNSETR